MAVDGYDHATMRAKRSLLKTILQVAVDQGWLAHNVVERTRLPRAVEQPNEDRVITPEEWAQIRLNLFGEGTLLLCDLTLDCGLRYEEVTALRPVDVVDGDGRNANHLWIRQAGPGPAASSPAWTSLGRSALPRASAFARSRSPRRSSIDFASTSTPTSAPSRR